ncbi:MAG: pitrilysin family protein [Gemmatimonadota bacterium]
MPTHTYPPLLAASLIALVALGGLPGPAASQEGYPEADIYFVEYELENGLHVILAPDPTATAVAVNLWYAVGSRDERPGRSGFAHLFEHLMFEGSENLEPGEHPRLVERAGGTLNASITEDRTNYFQTLPPERMNLGLWLEAERMRALIITEENMRREVGVVKEERDLQVDNAPYGTSLLETAHYAMYDPETCFPYAHSVIGAPEDLDAANLGDVQEFFDVYYAPGNATLTVSGAFQEDVARSLVDEYFSPIPGRAPPPVAACEAPFSHLPVRREVTDAYATLPAVWLSYGTVSQDHPDAPALEVLARILGVGQTSRLHERLVRDEQAAVQIGGISAARLGPGLLRLVGISNQGVSADRVLELLDEEIDRVRSEGVTAEEVERVRNQVRAETIRGRQTVMGRAEALQSANRFYGSPAAAGEVVRRIEAVTPADVARVAERYLSPSNRAVVITVPASGEAP